MATLKNTEFLSATMSKKRVHSVLFEATGTEVSMECGLQSGETHPVDKG